MIKKIYRKVKVKHDQHVKKLEEIEEHIKVNYIYKFLTILVGGICKLIFGIIIWLALLFFLLEALFRKTD